MKKYLIKIMILMMFILCVGCSDINNKDKTEEKKRIYSKIYCRWSRKYRSYHRG